MYQRVELRRLGHPISPMGINFLSVNQVLALVNWQICSKYLINNRAFGKTKQQPTVTPLYIVVAHTAAAPHLSLATASFR